MECALTISLDFADFAGAPAPSPASVFAATASQGELPAVPTSGSPVVPYTKWYRVWERTTPRDFYQEALVLPFIIVLVGLHVWGRRKNKRKARGWIAAHAPILEKEFSVVGFGGRKAPTIDDVQQSGLAKATNKATVPDELLKEKTAQEYTTYATGRQNVASVDAKLSLFKRYNPLTLILEWSLSIFFDSMRAPVERMEMTAYAFDGKEKDLIPVPNKRERENLESRIRGLQSSYDGFVWAVVHKDEMRHLREDRYDISLTSTKDNAKLPPWAIVMSESAEITNLLLTNELITLLNKVGERTFDYLIVTDQPLTKPQKSVLSPFLT